MATNIKTTKSFVLLTALVFVLAISFSTASAYPFLNSSSAHDFNGTVYFPNGTAAAGVNITVTLYDYNNGTSSSTVAADLLRSYTEMTNVNGFFSFTEETNISGSPGQLWLIEFLTNATAPASTNKSYIGPRFSPMSIQRIAYELSNRSIYLQPAAHFNLTSMFNATGHSSEFNFTVIDNALGIRAYNNGTLTEQAMKFGGHTPIASNDTDFVLPKNRNSSLGTGYTFVVWRSGPYTFGTGTAIDSFNGSGPVAFYFPINASYHHNQTINLELNTSLSSYTFQGNLSATGSGNTSPLNFTGTTRYVHLAHNGNITLLDFPFNNNTGADSQYGGGASPTFIDFSSTGNFNVTVPGYANDTGTTSIGKNQSYILAAFANASADTTAAESFYYGAFINMSSARHDNTTFIGNLQMRRLGGIQYHDDINATKVLFNPVNATNFTVGTVFDYQVEVVDPSIHDTETGTTHIVWTGTSNASGYFAVPLLVTRSAIVTIYHSAYAPQEFHISPSEILATTDATVNVGMINLSVQEYAPDDPDGGGLTAATMDVYNTTAACGNATLTLNICPAAARFGQFTSELLTKALNFPVTNATLRQVVQNSIEFNWNEVDLSSTGYPTPLVDREATKSNPGGYFIYSWKVGSNAPSTVYRDVEVGFPYEDNEINDEVPITVNITKVYNSKWNVIWDNNENGSNNPATKINDLAVVNASLFTGNVLCSKNDTTQICFVNKSKNRVYVKFPHFTGYQVNINGTAVPPATTTGTTGGSGGGGGAGGSGLVSGSLYWSAITGGSQTTFLSSEPRIPVTKIVFTPVEDLTKIRLTVKTFDTDRPADVTSDVPGTLYDYMEIIETHEDGNFILDESATIDFQVDSNWLTEGNVDANSIALYRWTEDNVWQRLPTSRTGTDGDFMTYQAFSEGFSYFAISAASELPPTVEGPSGLIPGPGDIVIPEELQKPSNVVLIFIIVVLLIFIVYELKKPHNKRASRGRRSSKRRSAKTTRKRRK